MPVSVSLVCCLVRTLVSFWLLERYPEIPSFAWERPFCGLEWVSLLHWKRVYWIEGVSFLHWKMVYWIGRRNRKYWWRWYERMECCHCQG